jgi:hypothetical protein
MRRDNFCKYIFFHSILVYEIEYLINKPGISPLKIRKKEWKAGRGFRVKHLSSRVRTRKGLGCWSRLSL